MTHRVLLLFLAGLLALGGGSVAQAQNPVQQTPVQQSPGLTIMGNGQAFDADMLIWGAFQLFNDYMTAEFASNGRTYTPVLGAIVWPGTTVSSYCGVDVPVGDPFDRSDLVPAHYCPIGGQLYEGDVNGPIAYLSEPWSIGQLSASDPTDYATGVLTQVAHLVGHNASWNLGLFDENGYAVGGMDYRLHEELADCLAGSAVASKFPNVDQHDLGVATTAISVMPYDMPNPLPYPAPDNGSQRSSALLYGFMYPGLRSCVEAFGPSPNSIPIQFPPINP